VQLLQALNPQDQNLRLRFCLDFQQWLREDGFAEKLFFSDEATFHMCGKVNRYNVRIWGTENPHATIEYVRDSPTVNVFCAVSSCKVYGQFFLRGGGGQLLPVLTTWTAATVANATITGRYRGLHSSTRRSPATLTFGRPCSPQC